MGIKTTVVTGDEPGDAELPISAKPYPGVMKEDAPHALRGVFEQFNGIFGTPNPSTCSHTFELRRLGGRGIGLDGAEYDSTQMKCSKCGVIE